MADRSFPFEKIRRDGLAYSAFRIDCAKCEAKTYMVQTGNSRKPPIAAEQYFRNHGWKVGNGPRADFCPSCQNKKPELKVVPMEPMKAEQPREMSRDDRRIIFQKIDEVYDDGRYSAPWTDSAVARDLGVPKAWVSIVRDEMFGPEGSNAEFDDFLARAEPLLKEGRDLLNGARSLSEAVRQFADRIEELEHIARKVEREIDRPASRRA